ncbi:class F sortase [Streptomyces sp. NBS 14/10]|uniref:class F sortase n=1 Tax=Streptomyces sp. NBS 14/10 TaxID=1945643 RepID=UPI000B7D6114|nr:class F sortase [Streptomyces sp. NBS 14/10]KAK1183112.1 class F sortase [Streptomyces sp. NBS 14/10]NUP45102.1 class F sortase [Streptomyces sp.]NUS86953.1 class F sortase [Streptomyces sp.]
MGKQGGADSNTRVIRWAAASALIGVFLIYNSVDAASTQPTQKKPAISGPTLTPRPQTAAPQEVRLGPALPRSPARHLDIPSIGVSAPFTELTLDRSGVLIPPPADNNNLAGWFNGGPSPGERGNAIVAGHVDTKTGPAVFYPLSALKTGSRVTITRADGIVATFVVDSVETFNKANFPDERVYGQTPDAQLRLITCGGSYDRAVRDYTANVVVFAHLDSFQWA